MAFDNNRKSCREQLSKHNARRRRRTQIEHHKAAVMVAVGEAAAGAEGGLMGGLVAAVAAAAAVAVGSDPASTSAIEVDTGCLLPQRQHHTLVAAVAKVEAAAALTTGSGAADKAPPGDVGQLLTSLMQQPAQLNALRLLLGVQTHAALPAMQPFSPELPPTPLHLEHQLSGAYIHQIRL